MNGLRTLIVDDDADFAETIAELVALNDCETEVAACGEEAVRRFRANDFDLCFLDVKLPEMDGFAVSAALRNLRPDVPIVMVSGCSMPELTRAGHDRDCFKLLRKPLDLRDLNATIDQVREAKSASGGE